MATIYDVDGDLRSLARLVPEDIRATLSPLELRLRLEAAQGLRDEADATSDSAKAGRMRDKANRMLTAMSPFALHLAMSVLDDQLAEARRRQDDQGAYRIILEIKNLERRNPQPDPERVVAAAQATVTRLRIPPPPSGSIWSRRNRRK
jgi:hypothetical protein